MNGPNPSDRQTVTPVLAKHLGLVDAVDHLLNRGAVVSGDATISLAGVDLVYLSLNLLVSSVETLHENANLSSSPTFRVQPAAPGDEEGDDPHPHPLPAGRGDRPPLPTQKGMSPSPEGRADVPPLPAGRADVPPLPAGRGRPQPGEGRPLSGNPAVQIQKDDPSRSLARLLLTLVETLRQILERQALRRVEGGTLSDDTVEQLGVALLDLESKLAELRRIFDLSEEDLNVDLGPLGQLL